MDRKWKAAIIAAAVLLLVGTLAFAQAGNSPGAEEQETPFSLNDSVWCGGPRGNYGGGSGGCGGPGGYNGNPDGGGNGNGGGFSCH